MSLRGLVLLFFTTFVVSACTKKAGTEKVSESSNAQESMKDLIEKGRQVYAINCTACHAVDPKKEGALGPAVQGASFELLEKRIVDGTYPENYKPKRPTKIMQPLPFLKKDLKALHAYLNQND